MSIHANGGRLVLDGFPEWKLMNLNAKLDSGVLEIEQSRYLVDERDELKISGKIDMRPNGGMELEGALENLLLSRLLPDYWHGKLDGRLGSDFSFAMEFGEGGGPVFSGTFEIRDFVLRGLPVFDTLAIYAGEHGLGFMEIPSVKGKFHSEGGVLTISDFESLKAGLLKMRGEITITDGQVGGVIEVGLPDAIFDKLAGGRPNIFNVEGSGFAWATMNLSGGVDSPLEDLSPKLMDLTRKRSEVRGEVANPAPTAPRAVNPAEKVLPGKIRSELPASDDERKKKIEDAFENLINGQ
ncbi:MAG: hypothetical protein P8J87_09185 [Verrucomicrobiales bacterium]|nr:hypothetical protein [Verrucomicrobiales bacterium]